MAIYINIFKISKFLLHTIFPYTNKDIKLLCQLVFECDIHCNIEGRVILGAVTALLHLKMEKKIKDLENSFL